MKHLKKVFIYLAVLCAIICLCFAFAPSTRFGSLFFGTIASGCALESIMLCNRDKNKVFRWISIVGIVLFSFFVLSFAIIQGIIQNGMHEDATEADYVIVLGAQVMPSKNPSSTLAARLERAKEYLDEYPHAKAVLCGAQGDNEPITEAEAMETFLLDQGIAKNRLILEKESRNTIQNIENAKNLIETNEKEYTAIVITSDFHCARARRLMERAELSPLALPAHTPLFSQRIVSRCREYCSILGLMVSGRW